MLIGVIIDEGGSEALLTKAFYYFSISFWSGIHGADCKIPSWVLQYQDRHFFGIYALEALRASRDLLYLSGLNMMAQILINEQ